MNLLWALVFGFATLNPSSTAVEIRATDGISLTPVPVSIEQRTGFLVVKEPTIVAISPGLQRIADVLAAEIQASSGVKPMVVKKPTNGSIVLSLTRSGPEESYAIDVDREIRISSPSLRGLCFGSVTLLQAMQQKGSGLQVPRMKVSDRPRRPFRGLMIDVARRYHSIDVLKQCVVLCHLYKLNTLQLHLSDDQAFTFPSSAFPAITTQNQNGGPAYSLQELKDLVQYADDRGVTIVPEMDIPGHSATLNRTMPDLFKIKGTKPYEHHATINFANPAVLKAVETLIGEMCEVFKSSPYFHMGGDEADISLADQHPDFQTAFQDLGLPPHSQQELFRRFIGEVDDIVKKRGKKLIVWEGFGRDQKSKFPIPKDALVMEFENAYYLPGDLLHDGYTLVNASWTPLYVVNRHVWPAEKVFTWDLSQFGRFSNLYRTTEWMRVNDTSRISGAQACSWEGPEELEIQNLRRMVPAMAEHLWNPASKSYERFAQRLPNSERLLDRLIQPVLIRSSALDAKDPNGFDVPCFTEPLTVTLRSGHPGTIRYTINGKPPTASSPQYSGPIRLTQTTTVRTAVFGTDGIRRGFESSMAFYYVPPHLPNLATGKKVTVSGGTQGPQSPELAVDDNLDLSSSWWAAPAPQWLQVDLGKVYGVYRIEVFPYWDGSRYYQYTVEVSADGKSWTQVADRSTNTKPSSIQGDEIRFNATSARFVKVNMLRCSANEAVHLVELRVWEAK